LSTCAGEVLSILSRKFFDTGKIYLFRVFIKK
jgi:hypothetical protein